ncbi:MAG: DUF2127 domain-containing protein [Candidatus Kapabacteria bacterium]|jgi:uncharacterized membrane protein (DUF2068 family)|nr:DUF2127 domain-containing protein [Candidatus Kapabacteria bacterium]
MHSNKYLRTIALYKIAKGFALLFIGISLVFLDTRDTWYQLAIEWLDEELMLPHGKLVHWLLSKIETFLLGDAVRSTGVLSLIYTVVLWIEGVGVYMGQRWAEWFMVVATAALIPLEIYHFTHKPTIVKFCVILANSAIVWYLWRTLHKKEAAEKEVSKRTGETGTTNR